ncbi:hypothetical protein [Mucilaginibacter phyllosphaerae]|uniref:Entericidin n=1 Tax=Mucilaginibacter phyllosphaerae TaxID=1812349 RepID=A0A4Y8A9K2_9SPHI|nr:hypothetical protein [Mucilaginibacter phyllosphaerae]MBB3969748.1 hypothetical protein [Mucilaginibacter phyllosphaerae]TEW65130.1 hypothetical protein E2R65_14535 [Mucilaginibacter phyllosphaerae]
MKALKYIAVIFLLSASVSACTGDRSKATLGGTQDTVAKAGTGDPNNTHALDSAKTDSVNKGNADPSGRGASDTLNSRPVH